MNTCRLLTWLSHSKQPVCRLCPPPTYSATTPYKIWRVCLPMFTRHVSTPRRTASENQADDGNLVYRGAITSMVRNVKVLSLSTSGVGLGLQPYLFTQSEHLGGAAILVGGVFSFFIFVTPVLLHYVTKKYVTELYLKPEQNIFTAYTFSFLLRRKKTVFTPNDVTVPSVLGPFSSIFVNGRALFMDPAYFTEPNAYRTMMGYNKPIDWSFPDDIKTKFHEKSADEEINDRK